LFFVCQFQALSYAFRASYKFADEQDAAGMFSAPAYVLGETAEFGLGLLNTWLTYKGALSMLAIK
jgi:hypothetical protein